MWVIRDLQYTVEWLHSSHIFKKHSESQVRVFWCIITSQPNSRKPCSIPVAGQPLHQPNRLPRPAARLWQQRLW
jgi:hypothetical protein